MEPETAEQRAARYREALKEAKVGLEVACAKLKSEPTGQFVPCELLALQLVTAALAE